MFGLITRNLEAGSSVVDRTVQIEVGCTLAALVGRAAVAAGSSDYMAPAVAAEGHILAAAG